MIRFIALLCVLSCSLIPPAAQAQEARHPAQAVAYPLSSGEQQNLASLPQVVHVGSVFLPLAESLQLRFSEVVLNGPDDAVIVESVRDGDVQVLDAQRLKEWQNHSAWFNGSAVLVSLRPAGTHSSCIATDRPP